jgi:PAS domain S-box-containing protein
MIELADALESSADGAFFTDKDLKIVYANRSAQKILDCSPDELTSRYCFQILRGRNDQGRRVCHEHCQVAKMILSGGRVSSFDLEIPTKPKAIQWLNLSVFRYSSKKEGNPYIVHLFREITQVKRNAKFVERLIEAAENMHALRNDPTTGEIPTREYKGLTLREREVLARLAEGYGTREIADQLSISVHTARNHIQHILQKLNVHTRLEAVISAINNDLIR